MTEVEIVIATDGAVRFVYDDALAPLLKAGRAVIRRASHVGPVGTDWYADLGPVRGPLLGPFALREDALLAERRWLVEHGTPFPS